jgi:hypothetical protein
MERARKARNPHLLLIPLRLALDLSSMLFANTPTYEIEAMPCENFVKNNSCELRTPQLWYC